jgi:hypothetical protein
MEQSLVNPEQQIPEVAFLDLPVDYWFEMALYLPAPTLRALALTNRLFAALCRKTVFWRWCLAKQYPEIDLHSLKAGQYLAQYQLKWADEIESKRIQLINTLRSRYYEDLAHFKSRLAEKQAKGGISAGKVKILIKGYKERHEPFIVYKGLIDDMSKKVKSIREMAYKLIPPPALESSYLVVTAPWDRYDDQFDNFMEAIEEKLPAEELLEKLKRAGFQVPFSQLARGNWIGIQARDDAHFMFPRWTIHILFYRDHLLLEKSLSAIPITKANRQNLPYSLSKLSMAELRQRYHLPFFFEGEFAA